MTIRKKSKAVKFLEKLTGRALTLGGIIESIRKCEDLSQKEFAKILGISPSHLCDIEQRRKFVSPERADKFAKILGYHREQFIRFAIQDMLDELKLPYEVELRKIS